ncbi:MAG: hypothetical protein R2865_08115 [Deinococcales bacterium]
MKNVTENVIQRYIIDASASVEYLLRTPLGLELAKLLSGRYLYQCLKHGRPHP